jgi:hypothetical protein
VQAHTTSSVSSLNAKAQPQLNYPSVSWFWSYSAPGLAASNPGTSWREEVTRQWLCMHFTLIVAI